MFDFSTISIVLYSLSGLLFIASFIIFFMTDVLNSIRFVRQKNKSTQSSEMITLTINTTKNSKNTENDIVSLEDIKQQSKISNNIEQVHSTTDFSTSDNDEENIETFATVDCNESENISFILTRNIIICHNDKGY